MNTPFYPEAQILDPVTNFAKVPGIVDYETKHKMIEDQLEKRKLIETQCKKQQTKKWYHIFAIQAVIALVSSGIVVLLLYAFNPPLTQKKRADDLTTEKQNWVAVLITAVIVFLLVLLVPELIRLFSILINKKKNSKNKPMTF